MSNVLTEKVRTSFTTKAILLLAIIVILQVPIGLIYGLISERQVTKSAAEGEVSRIAGGRQTIAPPIVTVPYITRVKEKDGSEREHRKFAHLLPDNARIRGDLKMEDRTRGIFDFSTYLATLTIDGSFSLASVSPPGIAPEDLLWDEATVSVGITDTRGLREQVKINWNGENINFEPGSSDVAPVLQGLRAKLPPRSKIGSDTPTFQIAFSLGGSSSLHFLPTGRFTDVALSSTSQNPSFAGAYLPIRQTVDDSGFQAEWSIPELGRQLPRVIYNITDNNSQNDFRYTARAAEFGVDFVAAVDAHRMTTRTVKYELLFFFMTYLVFFLFEVFCKIRLHTIQYLLVGAAVCLFYLLLLSFSEHVGFGIAYAISTGVVVALVTGYSRSILESGSRSWLVGGVLALLYGYYYVILQEEDYALLMGSIGLTITLGAVMYFTRNINWHNLSAASSTDNVLSEGKV